MSSRDSSKHEPRNDLHNTGNPNLDPSAANDPDLEEGGSVRPGATPPESNSATASPAHRPDAPPPRTKWALAAVGGVVAIIVMIFVAYAVGLFG